MTKDDIICMGHEADAYANDNWNGKDSGLIWRQNRDQHFAALVALHEREDCAKVCDVLAVHPEYASEVTKLAAMAIRARSQS